METNLILSNVAVNVTDFRKNPIEIVKEAEGEPVAILNRSEPAFYCIPADLYEQMYEMLEDDCLCKLINSRKHEKPVKVSIDEL